MQIKKKKNKYLRSYGKNPFQLDFLCVIKEKAICKVSSNVVQWKRNKKIKEQNCTIYFNDSYYIQL